MSSARIASTCRSTSTANATLAASTLAASTFAVRVAASARAHPYAVVSAGLGALDGPLHGAASAEAHRMLRDAAERGSDAVVADHLRSGRRVPGLGHRGYRHADPRAEALFAALPADAPAVALAREIEEVTGRHRAVPATVDLAVAALSRTFGMPADAGETIFAVARVAGWIGHALEEYAEAPLRMRPGGLYRGPRPPRPLPGATPPPRPAPDQRPGTESRPQPASGSESLIIKPEPCRSGAGGPPRPDRPAHEP